MRMIIETEEKSSGCLVLGKENSPVFVELPHGSQKDPNYRFMTAYRMVKAQEEMNRLAKKSG